MVGFFNNLKKLASTTPPTRLSILRLRFSSLAESSEAKQSRLRAAEEQRQAALAKMYVPHFKRLDDEAERRLIWSGYVWWNATRLDRRGVVLSEDTKQRVLSLSGSSQTIAHDALSDDLSPKWIAFRPAMTHHSTALEGNKLSLHDTAAVIDEFGEGISQGVGISEPLPDRVLHGRDRHDVEEVVNHAAALQWTKHMLCSNQEKKPISLEDILKMFDILMPQTSQDAFKALQGRDLSTQHHPQFRTTPIRVTGSPVVRPYAQEIPVLMRKILVLHQQHLLSEDPFVAAVLLMLNFLYMHPFPDGNGRVSRLILQVCLFNFGYHGCLIPFQDRKEFFSMLTPYYLDNQVDALVNYMARKTQTFHNTLRTCEDGKLLDALQKL